MCARVCGYAGISTYSTVIWACWHLVCLGMCLTVCVCVHAHTHFQHACLLHESLCQIFQAIKWLREQFSFVIKHDLKQEKKCIKQTLSFILFGKKNYVGILSRAQDGISAQYWPEGSSNVSDLHLQHKETGLKMWCIVTTRAQLLASIPSRNCFFIIIVVKNVELYQSTFSLFMSNLFCLILEGYMGLLQRITLSCMGWYSIVWCS